MTSTHKHHIIFILQYPSHKCLPGKSCPDCLRILIMPWLFKDPVVIMEEIVSWLFKNLIVTVAWLNFDHAQSNSIKWPKKINLGIKWILFLEKQIINFHVPISPFHGANFLKKNSESIQNYEGVPFSGPKWPIYPQKNFFGKNR